MSPPSDRSSNCLGPPTLGSMPRTSLVALTLLLVTEEERNDWRCREEVLRADGQWRRLPVQGQTDDGTSDSTVQLATEVTTRWCGSTLAIVLVRCRAWKFELLA